MIGGGLAFVGRHDQRSALRAHQHLVAGLIQIVRVDGRAAGARGQQRRFVHQVGEVRAGKPGRAARHGVQVHVRTGRHLAGVNREDRLAPAQVGVGDGHLPVEPAGPHQGLVEDVGPVGRGDDDDALVRGEAVHLDEQLIERLLALFVAERLAATAAADGVELVDEDDAGRVLARLLEQLAHAAGADAGKHLHEVRAAGKEKRHARFAGNRARQQRLARARRADQQHALGNAAADGAKAAGLAKELDDFLELVLGFVHAGDIGKGNRGAVLDGLAGVLFDRGHPSGAEAVEGKAQQPEEGERDHQGAGAEHRAGAACLDLDANAARDQVRHKRLMGGGVAQRRGGLHAAAVGLGADEPIRLDIDLAQGAGVGGFEEVGERDLARRRPPASKPGQEHQGEHEQAAGHDDGGTTVTGCDAHGLSSEARMASRRGRASLRPIYRHRLANLCTGAIRARCNPRARGPL